MNARRRAPDVQCRLWLSDGEEFNQKKHVAGIVSIVIITEFQITEAPML